MFEWLTVEFQKGLSFGFVRLTWLCDWSETLAQISRPMRSKTETVRDLFAAAPATCYCIVLRLAHYVVLIRQFFSVRVIGFGFVLRYAVEHYATLIN